MHYKDNFITNVFLYLPPYFMNNYYLIIIKAYY